MTTLADKAILSGADNRPPMLEKDMYDSWKSITELYMMNRKHRRMVLESVENGPLIWPTIEENGVTRPKKYFELSATEAIQADCDVKATNIILQGLPPEVYALVSNHRITKELWERIQLLMQGTSLTKQERESSYYEINTAIPAYKVSTASPNVNTANPQVSTASFSDNDVYAFMIKNPNGSNLLQQDLEQIHENDLEAIDLKWQLSLLSMRAKRYYQRTGKKIFINGVGYDKSKVECFNCHKMRHFARECRSSRNKEGQFRNQDNTRKQGNNEDSSSKAMLAIDGVGFNWSDMAEEQVQTNMALMAFSDSEVYNDKTCSKTSLKNYETLKKQCDDLIVKLNQTEFTAATYKRGLAAVEKQLITYRKNEVLFSEEFAVLKRGVACKDYEINVIKSEFEKVKQEKEGIEFKTEKFDKASKDLDKLLGSQITDKSKNGLGYNAVPPSHPLICLILVLMNSKSLNSKHMVLRIVIKSLMLFVIKKSNDSKENSDDSFVKEQVSKDTSSFVESSLNVDKETVFPVDKKVEFVKPKNPENPIKKSIRYAEMYRSQSLRGESKKLEWTEV
ncbi:ribonuclease H-like domain-containing protein [Tanacetum coccineum]